VKKQARILVVDDEERFVRALQVNLEAKGYEVCVAYDGQSALAIADTEEPDLVMLDLRMPGMDGFEVCQRIRAFSTVPIIMLTGLTEDTAKVKGLDTGADDYLTKPFSVDELFARVRAALRRRDPAAEPPSLPVFRYRDLLVDFDLARVFVQGEEVDLTSNEYAVLSELIRNSGQTITTEHLLDLVHREGDRGDAQQIQQLVLQLCRKIEPDPENPEYIVIQAGTGYSFQAQD
jgi:DNA-binding response OmpR family regulator